MECAMKKLVLIFLVGLLSVSFAEMSDDEIEAMLESDGFDCMANENPVACQSLINDTAIPSVSECNVFCTLFGNIYEIAGYTDEAIEYYEKSLATGGYGAAYSLAKIYHQKENFAESKIYFEIACEKINAKLGKELKGNACFNLGIYYNDGKGVRQDFHKAFKLYKKACDLDNAGGCNNLGVFYSKGQGVKQNKSTAKQYYGKACDLGDQMGCDNYRILNESGVQ